MTDLPYHILCSGLTDVGLVRTNNEDAWERLDEFKFYVLADGMGGHRAGEIASKEAISSLCDLIKEDFNSSYPITSLRNANQKIRKAIENTNRAVHQMGKLNRHLRGMGTTICCLYFLPMGVIYANVGDSRIYRMRDKQLEQLTIDHSLLADLEMVGDVSPSALEESSYKNIITKAIGTEAIVEPAVHECDISNDDIFLMCSDGLSDLLTREEIEKVMLQSGTLDEAANYLVERAKERGGHDNVTVVLTQVKMNNDLSR